VLAAPAIFDPAITARLIEPKGSRLLISEAPVRDPEETMRTLTGTVLALFLAAAPAAAEDWKEYNYPDQGVAIQFPAKPQAMNSTYDSIYVKGLPSLVISAEDDHVIYKLTVVDLSARSDMGTNFLVEAAIRMQRNGEVLSTDFPHVYNGVRSVFGVTLVVDRRDGSRVRSSLYHHKGRLYIAEAVVLPARGDKDMTTPSRYDQTIRFPPDSRFD
jgi:hypothetical protein